MLDDQKRIMTDVWEEEQRRIQQERATLKDQLSELASIHNDLDQIICISKHLHSFAVSGSIDRAKAERDAERVASRKSSTDSPRHHRQQQQQQHQQQRQREQDHHHQQRGFQTFPTSKHDGGRDRGGVEGKRGSRRDGGNHRDSSGAGGGGRGSSGSLKQQHSMTLPRSSSSPRSPHIVVTSTSRTFDDGAGLDIIAGQYHAFYDDESVSMLLGKASTSPAYRYTDGFGNTTHTVHLNISDTVRGYIESDVHAADCPVATAAAISSTVVLESGVGYDVDDGEDASIITTGSRMSYSSEDLPERDDPVIEFNALTTLVRACLIRLFK